MPYTTYTKEQKMKRYEKSLKELKHLAGDTGKYEMDSIGNMATIVTVLKMNLPLFLFVGFYRVTGKEMLQIGPYQGLLIACGNIPFSKGVCGACATKKETIIVPDVTQFPGYIACDDETQSEIVVPVFHNHDLVAVLDIDTVKKDAFDEVDKKYLEKIVQTYL